MKYHSATFRILIDSVVQVEVSLKGCDHEHQSVSLQHVQDAAQTIDMLTQAISTVQRRIDRKRGKRAASKAADPPVVLDALGDTP